MNVVWCGAIPNESTVGPTGGKVNWEQCVNSKSTLSYFHVVLLGCCHKTMFDFPPISMGAVGARWVESKITASLPHSGASHCYVEC